MPSSQQITLSEPIPFTETLKQLFALPTSIKRIHHLIQNAFRPEFMDQSLFDVYGSLHQGLEQSELRVWNDVKGGFQSVHPNQIERTSKRLWIQMILFAAESEAPIHSYSTASAEILRAFLPSLSIYMGRTNEEEKAFFEKNGNSSDTLAFCDSVWCREESRHGPTLVGLANRISGQNIERTMTFEATYPGEFSNEQAVYKHIIARNTSEWHANGLYLYLQTHASGATSEWLENVRADETRHLTVFSAAYQYLFGPRYGKRIKDMMRFSAELKRAHKKRNNHGKALMEMNTSTLIELGIIHLLIESKVRSYLKTVPTLTLRKLFESELRPKYRPQGPISSSKLSEIQASKVREQESRAGLLRWPNGSRKKEMQKRSFEENDKKRILEVIEKELLFFRFITSLQELELRLKSLDLDQKFKLIIRELYRDYQIMSQGVLGSRRELDLVFQDLNTGFVVKNRRDQLGKDYACFCKAITTEQVIEAMDSGHRTLAAIQEKTTACTGCGKCERYIRSLL